MEDYEALVRRFKAERRETLSKYPGLKPDILAAI
jgi:hypothetical protein